MLKVLCRRDGGSRHSTCERSHVADRMTAHLTWSSSAAASAGSTRRARSRAPPCASRFSIVTTTICSSRCCTRSRPRRCRRPMSRRRSDGFSGARQTSRCCWRKRETIEPERRRRDRLDGREHSTTTTSIVATGAAHAYFGHPEWASRAPGLKTLDDALEIRRRMLLAFEAAERESDAAAQRAAAHLRDRRRRPDRRRAGRRARRDRPAHAAAGLPIDPSGIGADRARSKAVRTCSATFPDAAAAGRASIR